MKRRSIFVAMVLMLVLCCSVAVSAAEERYSLGAGQALEENALPAERLETMSYSIPSGTSGIAISNASQLMAFRDRVNAGESSLNAYLTCDIDLKNSEWEPIGTSKYPYAGKFDGNGYGIVNLNVKCDYAGLFGLTDGAFITSLGVSGVVVGNSAAGGIVAGAWNTDIIKSFNLCDIRNGNCSGGIVGAIKATDNHSAIVASCFNLGEISCADSNSTCFVGGIVGLIGSGEVTIFYTYNWGNIACLDGPSGGIVGAFGEKGVIANVYNLGFPDKAECFGEIAGFISGNGAIVNSYYLDRGYGGFYSNESTFEHEIYYAEDISLFKEKEFVDRLNNGNGDFIFDEFGINSGFPLLSWEVVPVTGVQLDCTSLELTVGSSEQVTATVFPENATVTDVTWISDNPSVATVVNGDVTAVKAGTATITATTVDGSKKASCKVTVRNKVPKFIDVKDSDWFAPYVYDLAGQGIISGMTETTFVPEGLITRGQFAKILAAASGEDLSAFIGKSSFGDVSTSAWYTPYVQWAYEKGIVSGMGNGQFAPEAQITREQMAAMICRYAAYKGVTMPKVNEKLVFKDDASISSWAKDYVYVMQQAGIINGYADGDGYVFRPQGNAKRSEAAKMISVFLSL